MTYAEASKYDYGSWKNSAYTGTRIPTFEEFIILCKRIGLHPYIELKQNGAYSQVQIQSLVSMVKKCGMAGKVTWISFASSYPEYVKAADPSARLGFLVSSVTAAVITTAQGLQTDTNEVFIDSSDYDADAVSRCQEAGLPLEIWTINNSTTIQNMDAYITGVTSDSLIAGKILHDAGMVYDYGITAVSLTGISAEYTGGNVPVGTPLSELMGISVTGYYSDGSAGAVTGYTLSGTITEGNNVITVSYDGFTATFTVTGVAGSGGEIEKTLTSISATYSGGDVAVGTDVTALSGVTVTAYYDDGTSETVTGYTLSGTIAEGENTVTVTYEGETTTFVVTDVDVVNAPVVNLSFADEHENVIPNIGTGGNQYDATVVDYNGTHVSSENGLILNGHAYANVAYRLPGNGSWTICVRGAFTTLNDTKYQRLFRTDKDMPSVFHTYDGGQDGVAAKLSGQLGATAESDKVSIAYTSVYIPETESDSTQEHAYVFVGDADSGLIRFYLDGELMASQAIISISNTVIGVGDNDQAKTYYADTITITDFRIWDTALSAEEVAAL
jgi:hypothetical protein